MHNKTENIQWINNLRVLATFSVIILHVCSSNLNTSVDYKWLINNFIDSSVRFCVPVFIMLSGALLIPKHIELGKYLRSRFTRIIIPLLFWTLIYIAYKLFTFDSPHDPVSIIKLIYTNFQYGASYHFWYVYMIIGIFLIIPVISPWAKNAGKNDLLFFIAIWLITLLFEMPVINKYAVDLNLIYFSKYIGYLLLGFYLSKFDVFQTYKKSIALALYIISFLFTAAITCYLTAKEGAFIGHFYNYLSLNIVIMSTGVFLFFKSIVVSNNRLSSTINLISKYSFGMYFAHILILNTLATPLFSFLTDSPILETLSKSVFCIGISFLLIYCLDKIPVIKKISY